MKEDKDNIKQISSSSEANMLIALFFLVSLSEAIAEFFEYRSFIFIFKMLLMPILMLLYWTTSSVRNLYYLIALFFAFIANMLFIYNEDFDFIIFGATTFLVYRIITIYLIMKFVKIKSYFPVIIGSLPFLFIYFYLTCLTIDELGDGLFVYIIQAMFMSFLGGLSVGVYMINDNRKNYWLLISTLLFTVNQILLVIKLFYLSVITFQPISMALYCFAQYGFYKFIILSEQKDLNKNSSSAS
ncbi:lysoplasmalogenase family protein [Flavobacterium terrae]|uniref:YhhN-like protein n=1 Tax=Flavobacterium terrae TaxID=415425 RepID=A0A1M6F7Z1_9FLAO|nr:lysoplasmalogenase family protein [Flavobacterium terrae]SHI93838.1 YhhN-like protein [Flavobacterium terrae]